MHSAPLNERKVHPAAPRSRGFWFPWLLVAIGVALYANGLSAPFLFDDVPQIVEEPRIRALWPLTEVVTGTSRPVLKLTLAVNYAVGELDVVGYHLVNVGIHILAALALFGVVRRTLLAETFGGRFRGRSGGIGFATALLWLVHPLQTESVTYVFQRCESLMGLLFLLTFYCVIRAAEGTHRGRWTAAAVSAAILGVGTKEVMVAVPLLILLYDRAFLAGSFRSALRQRRVLYASLASLWIVLGALVMGLLFRADSMAGFGVRSIGPVAYAMAQPGVIVHYLVLSAWPHAQCLDYGWSPARDFLGTVAPLVVVASLLAGTGWALWRNSWVGFVGAWFFLILAPTSSFMPINDLAVEHRMYLPLAALVLLVVLGGERLIASLPFGDRRLALLLLFLAAAVLGRSTFERNREYGSIIGMWETVVARAPGNARGHMMLGNALRDEGRIDEAIACYNEALRRDPDHVPTLTNLGRAQQSLGNEGRAIECLRRVVELAPDHVHATNLGNAYLQAGQVDDAIVQYRAALSILPGFAPAQSNFGAALMMKGRVNEAILHLEQALDVDPDDVAAITNLGNARYRLGDVEGAILLYQRALALDADYGMAHVNLGAVLLDQGEAEEAVPHFQRARALAPRNPGPAFDLGRALLAAGRPAVALAEFRATLLLDAGHASAHLGAAEALLAGADPAGFSAVDVVRLGERGAALTRRRDPDLLMRLADLYGAGGRPADGVGAAEEALALSADDDARLRIQTRLEILREEAAGTRGGNR